MANKKVSDSSIDDHFVEIFPGDLNSKGTVFGGRVLEVLDRVAGHVAQCHCQMLCVTLFMDSVRFLAPARQGEVLIYKASVNRVWGSSLEVGVKVFAVNLRTTSSHQVLSAYVTFVAVNEELKPTEIPFKIEPITDEQKRRYDEADDRRKIRLSKNKTR